jgi:uncharacterized membrane protein
MLFIKTLVATAIPMLLLDFVWLSTMAPRFYRNYIGDILAKQPNYIAAGIFYVIYVIGVAYFIVYPAVQGNLVWWHVALRGALFGFVAYATYDLTNQATLIQWSSWVTVVDLAWGALLTAVVSTIAFFIIR